MEVAFKYNHFNTLTPVTHHDGNHELSTSRHSASCPKPFDLEKFTATGLPDFSTTADSITTAPSDPSTKYWFEIPGL